MDDDLLAYYNDELAFVREMGAEFATKYPKVAHRLQLEADKCADPHVERLLEGFAFLTARVRRKIDDQYPEITGALLDVLYPHYLRPVPPMTVVQLVPAPEAAELIDGFTIPRGARLNSRPVAGSACQFRTAYPVTLWPLEVAAAQLSPDRVVFPGKRPEAVALLRLGLRCTGAATFGKLKLDHLRFHLDGDGPLAHALYVLLLNQTCQVLVRHQPAAGAAETVELPAGSILPVGFGRDEGMFPYPDRSFPGYRLIQEYFAFPEKFLFFDVANLGKIAGRGWGASAELLFFFNQSPRGDLPVLPDNFRLGCAPAANLFELQAEPIALNQTQTEYRVVPDVHRPNTTEIYSVDDVRTTSSFLKEPRPVEPFYAMRHATGPRAQGAYWHATRRPSGRQGDDGTEVYLSFVDPNFKASRPAAETAVIRATCTNRDLASRLPFGGPQGDFALESPGPVSRARCLRKPTAALRPPMGRGAQWRLIAHLSLNHLSLADDDRGPEPLRQMLRLYDFADSAANRQQIEGLVGVSHRRIAGRTGRTIGGPVCLGIEVTAEFDESQYVGSGVYLFAAVIERFVGTYTSINSFTQLVAKTRQREGILRRWPPRSGERTLL